MRSPASESPEGLSEPGDQWECSGLCFQAVGSGQVRLQHTLIRNVQGRLLHRSWVMSSCFDILDNS